MMSVLFPWAALLYLISRRAQKPPRRKPSKPYTGGFFRRSAGPMLGDGRARAVTGKTRRAMDSLVPGRACGDCKVCCIVPPIDEVEMQKIPNAICRHRLAGGCNIYDKRPTACRTYFCGWRRLAFLDDDWRPDKSGVLIESGTASTVGPDATVLILVANPLKTIRQQKFLDFVRKGIEQKAILFLSLPGAAGQAKAALSLSTPEMRSAAAHSRSHLRLALEDVLRRLSRHEFQPYVIENRGNDVSIRP